MKRKLDATEILEVLREFDAGVPVKEICRAYSISKAEFSRLRAKYGVISAVDGPLLQALAGQIQALRNHVGELLIRDCYQRSKFDENEGEAQWRLLPGVDRIATVRMINLGE